MNNLVIALKANGFWTDAKAIFPIVGGTATTHSYNLRNTAQFQITWAGSPTHSTSAGVDFNGSSQDGKFALNPSTQLSASANTFVYYTTDTYTSDGNDYDMGCRNTSGTATYGILCVSLLASGTQYATYYPNAQAGAAFSIAHPSSPYTGDYIMTRRTDSDTEIYKRGSSLGSNSVTRTAGPPNSSHMALGGFTDGATNFGNYSPRNCVFAGVWNRGFTGSEAATLSTIINDYETDLGRNSY